MPLRRATRALRDVVLGAGLGILAGCTGVQSSLDPAGRGAERIADIFWWMAGGTVVVLLLVSWLAWSAARGRLAARAESQARLYIIGGGAIFPTIVLAVLLVHGLGEMPALLAPVPAGSLRIEVSGEQYWWRVRYVTSDGREPAVLANEIRLPVGEPVEFLLDSPDVIHSFWIPALGGKIDLIPGRRTRLRLEPTRIGTFRGQCAEFCGTSHAYMAFAVVVTEKADFERWLAEQRAPARAAPDALASRGAELFMMNGCAACHAIRGTEARGSIGPDLTHVGGRLTLGAGILANDPPGFARWISATETVKPGVRMPHFGMLPDEELGALAAYLDSLQ